MLNTSETLFINQKMRDSEADSVNTFINNIGSTQNIKIFALDDECAVNYSVFTPTLINK